MRRVNEQQRVCAATGSVDRMGSTVGTSAGKELIGAIQIQL